MRRRVTQIVLSALLMVSAAVAAAGELVWTNPPGRVLGIHFLVTAQDGPAPRAWDLYYPLYYVDAKGDTTWRSHGGMPDSLAFTGSCRSAPVTYVFVCFAWNEAGECKDPSDGGVPVSMVVLP